MKRGAHTLEFIILFFGNGNINEWLLHLRADPKPTKVNQKNYHLFRGFCVRPVVRCVCTCIVTSGRLCFLVLVGSSVPPASSESFLLGSPALVLTKELGI